MRDPYRCWGWASEESVNVRYFMYLEEAGQTVKLTCGNELRKIAGTKQLRGKKFIEVVMQRAPCEVVSLVGRPYSPDAHTYASRAPQRTSYVSYWPTDR